MAAMVDLKQERRLKQKGTSFGIPLASALSRRSLGANAAKTRGKNLQKRRQMSQDIELLG